MSSQFITTTSRRGERKGKRAIEVAAVLAVAAAAVLGANIVRASK